MTKLLAIRDYLVAQDWWPNRRVLLGSVTAALTFVVVKVGFNADDPTIIAAISLAAGKAVEYLLPPNPVDVTRAKRNLSKRGG